MNKIVLLLLLTASFAFAQNKTVWNNYKNKVDNKKEYKNINDSSNSKLKTSSIDSLEKGFSLNLGIGYLFPQKGDGPGGIESGLAIRLSLLLKTSKNITWFTEIIYSKLKYEDRFGGLYGGHTFYLDYMLLNVGLRIYPKSEEKIYIKLGSGLAYSPGEESSITGYSVNVGIGNDFRINKKINLFAEGEILFHKLFPFSSWYSLYDIILNTGIKYKL